MADYYSLISRAVAALPQSTPEARRAVYERARAALIGHLRSLDPPAPEADIAAESHALDAAVLKIELDLAPATKAVIAPPQMRSPDRVQAVELPTAEPAVSQRPKANVETAPSVAKANSGRRWMVGAGVAALVAMAVIGYFAKLLPNPPFDQKKPANAVEATSTTTQPQVKIIERVGKTVPDAAKPGADPQPPASQPVDTIPAVVPPTAPAPIQPANEAAPAATVAAAPAQPAADPGAVPVAQRAALLVQVKDPAPTPGETPKTQAFVGTVVWQLQDVSGGSGQPLQKAVRADISIPTGHINVTLLFEKNLDTVLPASHTMQIDFTLDDGNPLGAIKGISMPEMREEGAPSGAALLGAPAAIMNNHFIAALAQGDSAEIQNLSLLKSRPWMDVPIITDGNLLAKLTLEKGPAGDNVLTQAINSWQK